MVGIKTFINPDGTSVSNLGREREGSGIVIDESGLVLTIGYLMVEAHAAEIVTNSGPHAAAAVVGYDHETGFGLLRTLEPLKIKPLAFGNARPTSRSRTRRWSRATAAPTWCCRSMSRAAASSPASWEYLVDDAIFTAPPHPAWSGAALINREGKLVGVGSLIVGDASGEDEPSPGNMFVPIDRLPPILGDLIAEGPHRRAGPAVARRQRRRRCTAGCWSAASRRADRPRRPACKRGDIIVGVNGEKTATLADFYRKVWALGAAGVDGAARRACQAASRAASTCSRSTGSTLSSCNRRSEFESIEFHGRAFPPPKGEGGERSERRVGRTYPLRSESPPDSRSASPPREPPSPQGGEG